MYQMITIPQPCSADWNAMTPEGKGRHCGQCCKTVVDFTQWENSDILAYLNKHASAGVCGHFRKAQLEVPIPTPEVFVQQINRSFLSLAQSIAAVFLFVFCVMAASCGNTVRQSPVSTAQQAPNPAGGPVVQQLTGDTILPGSYPVPVPISESYPDQALQGEPAIMPDSGVTSQDPGPVLGGAPVIEARRFTIVPDTPDIMDTLLPDTLR